MNKEIISSLFASVPIRWRWSWLIYLAALYLALRIGRRTRSHFIVRSRLKAGHRRRKEAQNVLLQLKVDLEREIRGREDVKSEWSEIIKLDVNTLLDKMRCNDLTPSAVLRAYQWKALEVHEVTNCLVEPITEATQWAATLDNTKHKGPLHGLPISIKENFFLKGYTSTNGQAKFLHRKMNEDAVLIQALKSVGAVPFVRSNVPQTLISYDCSNPIYGTTLNPLDLARGPGGSSGGEGALIRAGGSILGLGSDIAGSVRLPAQCCGVTSLKPTSARLSLRGSNPSVPGVQGIKPAFGFMGRDVDTIALAMKSMLSDVHFDLDPQVPPIPFNENMYSNPDKLRIGYYTTDQIYQPTPGCQRAVMVAVDALSQAGHDLVEVHEVPGMGAYNLALSCLACDGGETLSDIWRDEPIDRTLYPFYKSATSSKWIRRLTSHFVRWFVHPKPGGIINISTGVDTVKQHMALCYQRDMYVREVLDMWKRLKLDAIVCPTMTTPAQPIGTPANIPVASCYTIIYNMLDFPAGVVPVTTVNDHDQLELSNNYPPDNDPLYARMKKASEGTEGLPLTVQCVALPWREEVCLRVMKELESQVKLNIQ